MSTSSKKGNDQLSDLQKDAVRELCTMGAGHAASALTEFLEQPIFMQVPLVKMISIDSIPDLLKTRFPSSTQIAISSADNTTEIFYTVLVLFDKEMVTEILDRESPPDDDIEAVMIFSKMFMDMIREIGSIILIKFIITCNMFLNITDAFPSQPNLRIGTLDTLEEYELKGFLGESKVIFVECDIYSEDESKIKAKCILIPHSETIDRFFGTIFTQYI